MKCLKWLYSGIYNNKIYLDINYQLNDMSIKLDNIDVNISDVYRYSPIEMFDHHCILPFPQCESILLGHVGAVYTFDTLPPSLLSEYEAI